MRTTPDLLASAHKHSDGATFSCFIRNYTPHALHLSTKFGALEAEAKMTSEAYRELLAINRATYAYRPPIALPEPSAPALSPSPAADPNW